MPSCRLLPHGSYALSIATLATLAWCSSVFQDGCDFAIIHGDMVQQIASSPDVPFLEFGIGAYREPHPRTNDGSGETSWKLNYGGACTEYPFDIDPAWTASKAFAFLALVIGGGGTLFVWCSTCFVFSRGTWRWAGYELLTASICQMLTFVWYFNDTCKKNSGSTCTLGWGSKADIVATVLWWVGACMAIYKYPNPKPVEDPDDSQNHMAEVNLTSTQSTQSQAEAVAVAEANAADMEASEEPIRANAEVI
jgi:hypothetical protein